MRQFVFNEEDGFYVVESKSMLKMNLIVKFVSVGMSFCQARQLYQSVKEETGMGIMGSISNKDVS